MYFKTDHLKCESNHYNIKSDKLSKYNIKSDKYKLIQACCSYSLGQYCYLACNFLDL